MMTTSTRSPLVDDEDRDRGVDVDSNTKRRRIELNAQPLEKQPAAGRICLNGNVRVAADGVARSPQDAKDSSTDPAVPRSNGTHGGAADGAQGGAPDVGESGGQKRAGSDGEAGAWPSPSATAGLDGDSEEEPLVQLPALKKQRTDGVGLGNGTNGADAGAARAVGSDADFEDLSDASDDEALVTAKAGEDQQANAAADNNGGAVADQGILALRTDAEPPEDARSPSSESSSSSSSSGSDSEDEADPRGAAAAQAAEPEAEESQVAEVSQYDAVKRAILKRDDLAKILAGLPLENAESAILRCFVRLAVQTPSNGEQDSAACVLAEVVGVEKSAPYQVARSDGQKVTLRIKLKCKRGSTTRLVKISAVSNRELEEREHEQWSKLTAMTGVDAKVFTDNMRRKAADIAQAKNFRFDEATVSEMLAKKGDLEFDSQKESRMQFLVQCAMSQMDISGIREHEAEELEQRYKDSLNQLNLQQAKATKKQEQWFEKRANQFSLKMINKKNYDRQVRDDRHALEYTLANERVGNQGLNPFERRACRPVVAWDTSMTGNSAPEESTAAPPEAAEPAKAVSAPAAADGGKTNSKPAAEVSIGEAPIQAGQRMERVVRAHSGARHILAGLSGFGR